ncbi:MAG: peptide chain release factor N(5)-glutamine methyltransferase [Blastocatellia bacterium]|nr:MAG: peptide chain release factor N(5)-glutamine methyltransferase [Blastocatellia bacterium]
MVETIGEALLEATHVLSRAGVPEARREAGSLLAFVAKRDRTFLISNADYVLSEAELSNFRHVVERRTTGEPQQYITGVQDFFNRQFKVTPDVLIPRPETELLIEAALKIIDNQKAMNICDVGTGSGCIAVTLLCERETLKAVAVDISDAALRIAEENAKSLGVVERISLVKSDCFESLSTEARFDLVVSNPPYVSSDALNGLQREVKDHEPLVALTPGADGLSVIRRLLVDAPQYLCLHGYLLMEIGFDQSEKLTKLIDTDTWRLEDILPDLQGIPRIAVLQLT